MQMTTRRFAWVAGGLLPAAALAVHELRYRLAFGEQAGPVLSEHGHGYLAALAPLVALLCAIGGARLLLGVARRLPDATGSAGFARMWSACAVVLFAVYGGQELLEGALSAGRPGGLDAVFAAGGWMSVPLCVVVGLGLASVLRLARAAASRGSSPRLTPAAPQPASPAAKPSAVLTPRACQLARRLAGRAPPLTV